MENTTDSIYYDSPLLCAVLSAFVHWFVFTTVLKGSNSVSPFYRWWNLKRHRHKGKSRAVGREARKDTKGACAPNHYPAQPPLVTEHLYWAKWHPSHIHVYPEPQWFIRSSVSGEQSQFIYSYHHAYGCTPGKPTLREVQGHHYTGKLWTDVIMASWIPLGTTHNFTAKLQTIQDNKDSQNCQGTEILPSCA